MTQGSAERDPTRWSPFHDKKGVPVCAGDLIKSYHFTGARRKRYYLYHVASYEDGHWMMVPASWADPNEKRDGGKCRIYQHYLEDAEVIGGCGPGDILDHEDRPRVAPAACDCKTCTTDPDERDLAEDW